MPKSDIDFLDGESETGEIFIESVTLPNKSILTHVTVSQRGPATGGIDTNAPPMSVNVGVLIQDHFMLLASGWIRNPSVQSGPDVLVWDGRIVLPERAVIRLDGRNNTGGTRRTRVSFVTERT